jgi:hypothetical protein
MHDSSESGEPLRSWGRHGRVHFGGETGHACPVLCPVWSIKTDQGKSELRRALKRHPATATSNPFVISRSQVQIQSPALATSRFPSCNLRAICTANCRGLAARSLDSLHNIPTGHASPSPHSQWWGSGASGSCRRLIITARPITQGAAGFRSPPRRQSPEHPPDCAAGESGDGPDPPGSTTTVRR